MYAYFILYPFRILFGLDSGNGDNTGNGEPSGGAPSGGAPSGGGPEQP